MSIYAPLHHKDTENTPSELQLRHECQKRGLYELLDQASIALASFFASTRPIEVYRDPRSHVTAAASDLAFAANSADFHPASQEPKALGQNVHRFLREISTSLGIGFGKPVVSFELDGSLAQFEKTISEQLEGPRTARALCDLVPDNVQDQSLTDWVLSLIVLLEPDTHGNVPFRLAQVYLTISSDANTAAIPKQSARLTVSDFAVNTPELVSNAQSYANKIHISSVHDFIGFFTSPKRFSRGDRVQRGPTSCFRNRQTFKDRQAILS